MKNGKTRYDLAVENAREALEELRLAAYEQGYEDARRQLNAKDPAVSAQARRDEIVEQAKEDVEESCYELFAYDLEFIVNREKRTVVALLRGCKSGRAIEKGIAKAAPSDCFNVHIGKAIALRRALGLAVPDEYLNAPQPTEVRVGDVVYYSRVYPHLTVSDRMTTKRDGFVSAQSASMYVGDGVTKIIDDSREEVGE
ncbi:hypothetical protein MOE67_13565 [Bacillus inaquosorum]|uniref:hypothetical protein n=1 Tax=Bacillus inaquosorum TaxID=483913 RepID=UPI002281D2D5|nr:hypothetical protein [Bacillus inaquosorum]MCY9063223.1 hypothetical protein [Bacillus inaquosorum]